MTSLFVSTPFQLPLQAAYAAFKERVDDVSHVLLWVVSGGQFRTIAHYVSEARRQKLQDLRSDSKTFCSESYGFTMDPNGHGPIATAARTGQLQYIPNAGAPGGGALKSRGLHMMRQPLLTEFGIRDVCFVPISLGVLEFGIAKTPRDVAREEIARFTQSREADRLFAYVIFWSQSDADGRFRIVSHYVSEGRRQKLQELRDDGKTYCSASYSLEVDPSDNDPIATAARTGQQQSVTDASHHATFRRRALAEEFQIQNVYFVPSALGVIEYGTPIHSHDDPLGRADEQKGLDFISSKMREIQKSRKDAKVRADKARFHSLGGTARGLGASVARAAVLRGRSSELLHRVALKMRGARGTKAPALQCSWPLAATSLATWLGVCATLLALSGANQLAQRLSDGQYVVILGSWGALMTLLFSAPASPLVQPRNIFGGNLVSASVAILFHYLSGEEYLGVVPLWLALAFAPATAISAMQFLGVSHPPAGAVSLLFIIGPPRITGMGWGFLLCPLLLGNVIAVLLASIVNNLSSRRQYPMYW